MADGFLFYANGLDTWRDGRHVPNHYARAAYYFITEASSAPPAFPTTTGTTSDTEVVSTFDAYATHNPQEYAWFSGGRQLFENYDYATGNSRNYTLTLPCRSAGNAGSLTIGFSAANSTSTRVTPQFNGSSLGTFTVSELGNYSSATVVERTFNVAKPSATNTVRISTTSGAHARLNFLTLQFTGTMAIDGSLNLVAFTRADAEPKTFDITMQLDGESTASSAKTAAASKADSASSAASATSWT